MQELKELFRHACQNQKVCILTDWADNQRVVAPYGVFKSSKFKQMLCVFQMGGFSISGKVPQWHNLSIQDFKAIQVSNETFDIRQDFHPENEILYPIWYFHV